MKKYFTLYIMNTYIAMSLLFLFSFGSYKIENIPISNPQSISVDPKGNIYLADTGNNRIIKYSQEGHFIKSIGGFGWDKEQFDTPMDICAKSVLDVFIADYNNHRIERYDKDLNYISSFYSDESQNENLQFGFPVGVSVSIHGELILIDSLYILSIPQYTTGILFVSWAARIITITCSTSAHILYPQDLISKKRSFAIYTKYLHIILDNPTCVLFFHFVSLIALLHFVF